MVAELAIGHEGKVTVYRAEFTEKYRLKSCSNRPGWRLDVGKLRENRITPAADGKQLQGKRNITVRVPFNLPRLQCRQRQSDPRFTITGRGETDAAEMAQEIKKRGHH